MILVAIRCAHLLQLTNLQHRIVLFSGSLIPKPNFLDGGPGKEEDGKIHLCAKFRLIWKWLEKSPNYEFNTRTIANNDQRDAILV